jgi:hypothetical protein
VLRGYEARERDAGAWGYICVYAFYVAAIFSDKENAENFEGTQLTIINGSNG